MKSTFFFALGLMTLINVAVHGQEADNKAPKGQSLAVPEHHRSSYLKFSAPPGQQSSGGEIQPLSSGFSEVNILTDDFESGSSKWTLMEDWEVGQPTAGPVDGYNSPSVLATKLNENYSPSTSSAAILSNIDLSSVSTVESKIFLEFYQWVETESGYDFAKIYVSTDGEATWSEISSFTGNTSAAWQLVSIDLSNYIGGAISLKFELTSDAFNEFSGWYIDELKIYEAVPLPLAINIVSIDAQNFPFIYFNVRVNAPEIDLSILAKEHFIVSENGVEQTDFFDIFPPQESGGTRRADIVFLMDNSASMAEEQAAIATNVADFITNLSNSGVDFALGLCRFGGENNGNPIIEENGILTSDIDYFINTLWARNNIDGRYEPGWDALHQSVTSFSFRPGSQKVFVLITDESVTGDYNQGIYTKEEAINILNANTVSVYSLIEDYDRYSVADYGEISEATKAKYYNIYSSFDDILLDIESFISNTYLVTYRSSTPVADGTLRTIQIKVDFDQKVDYDEDSYIAGNIPKVAISQDTRDLSSRGWAESTLFTITAIVKDNAEPFTTGATLYYKPTVESAYYFVSMTNNGSDVWEAEVPQEHVVQPGLDYYITATDGENTSSSPTVNPSVSPYQIAILPNEAPVITHTMPENYEDASTPILINAIIEDQTNSIVETTLFYREYGQLIYKSISMILGGSGFSAEIPVSSLAKNGVEYFIYAKDDFGVGSSVGTFDVPLKLEMKGTVVPPSDPLLITLAATHPSACGNPATGSIVATAAGGTKNYMYSLDGIKYGGDATFTGLTAGNYTVYVKDADGAVVSGAITLTANEDTEGPTATPVNIELTLDANGQATLSSGQLLKDLTDNCSSLSEIVVQTDKSTFTCDNLGVQQVAVRLKDAKGNSSIIYPKVTVKDTQAPTIAIASTEVFLDANGIVTLDPAAFGAGTTDLCTASDALTYTLDKSTFTCSDLGNKSVILTVSDISGNVVTSEVVITVKESIAPTLAVKSKVALSLDGSGKASVTTSNLVTSAADNCTPTNSLSYKLSKAEFACNDIGTVPITVTVTDAQGNETKQSVDITITDKIIPIIKLKSFEIVLNQEGKGILSFADINNGTADNCTTDSKLLAELSKTTFTCSDIGTKSVGVTVTDVQGNKAAGTVEVTVADTEGPEIKLKPFEVALDREGSGLLSFKDIDNGTVDNCTTPDKLEIELSVSEFTCLNLGKQEVTVTAKDVHGNSSETKIMISIIESVNCTVTGLATHNVPDLVIYPNPIGSTITLVNKSNFNQARIYDLSGKLVLISKVVESAKEIKLNTECLDSGIYVLETYNSHGQVKKSKIIKE